MEALSRRHYETCHLPGAINLPYEFVDEAEEVLRDKRVEILVYCMNEECEASREEARELEEMGYENVVHHAGGKQGRLPSARSSRVRWSMTSPRLPGNEGSSGPARAGRQGAELPMADSQTRGPRYALEIRIDDQ